MPKKNSSTGLSFLKNHTHNLVPSSIGGAVAYLFSGVIMLGLIVFAAVWIGNMIGHNLHKHK